MMACPEILIDRPTLASPRPDDLLSDVLGHIRLSGERVEIVPLRGGASLDPGKLAGACLFVVAAGQAIMGDGTGTRVVATGDLVLLPTGMSAGGLRAGPERTELLLARFSFDARSLDRMMLVLPTRVHISMNDGQPWLDGIAGFLRIEALDDQPGSALMVSRLIDLTVIRALRTWAQAGNAPGWLGGLADARIARALAALHADPLRRWKLAELGETAGMSRSSFCDRFAALVGQSPLRYHNALRLGLARGMIVDQGMRVGAVALMIGYESDAAFSRAYKALFGRSPNTDR